MILIMMIIMILKIIIVMIIIMIVIRRRQEEKKTDETGLPKKNISGKKIIRKLTNNEKPAILPTLLKHLSHGIRP